MCLLSAVTYMRVGDAGFVSRTSYHASTYTAPVSLEVAPTKWLASGSDASPQKSNFFFTPSESVCAAGVSPVAAANDTFPFVTRIASGLCWSTFFSGIVQVPPPVL